MTWILRREVEKVVTVASQRRATTGLTTLSSAYQVMSADRAHECEHHGRGRYRGSSPVVLIHIFVGRAAVFLMFVDRAGCLLRPLTELERSLKIIE